MQSTPACRDHERAAAHRRPGRVRRRDPLPSFGVGVVRQTTRPQPDGDLRPDRDIWSDAARRGPGHGILAQACVQDSLDATGKKQGARRCCKQLWTRPQAGTHRWKLPSFRQSMGNHTRHVLTLLEARLRELTHPENIPASHATIPSDRTGKMHTLGTGSLSIKPTPSTPPNQWSSFPSHSPFQLKSEAHPVRPYSDPSRHPRSVVFERDDTAHVGRLGSVDRLGSESTEPESEATAGVGIWR